MIYIMQGDNSSPSLRGRREIATNSKQQKARARYVQSLAMISWLVVRERERHDNGWGDGMDGGCFLPREEQNTMQYAEGEESII